MGVLWAPILWRERRANVFPYAAAWAAKEPNVRPILPACGLSSISPPALLNIEDFLSDFFDALLEARYLLQHPVDVLEAFVHPELPVEELQQRPEVLRQGLLVFVELGGRSPVATGDSVDDMAGPVGQVPQHAMVGRGVHQRDE